MRKGVIIPLVLIVFMVILVGTTIYLFSGQKLLQNPNRRTSTNVDQGYSIDTEQEINTKEWTGILWAQKGFIKINTQGQVEKDTTGNATFFLPPGMKAEYIYNNFTGISNNGEDIFKNALQLLDNGRLVFIGSPEIKTAIKRNTLYSWQIGSQEYPKPIFELNNGKKIHRFTFSPSKEKVAIVSITKDEMEVSLETKDAFQSSLENLRKELGTVNIYNISTNQQLKSIEFEKQSEGGSRLAWKGKYLYFFKNRGFWVFDLDKEETIYTESSTQCESDRVVISQDGTKFTCVLDQLVKTVPSKENLVKFEVPTYVSYNAFSFDSKKLLVAKTKDNTSLLSDIDALGELNLNTGKINIIGKLEFLIEDLHLDRSKEESGYYLPFAVYNPTGDFVIFTIDKHGSNYVNSTDIYYFHLEDSKTKVNNLKIDLATPRDVAFIGWYKI